MRIQEKAGDEIALIEEELTEKLDGWRLEHIFPEIIITKFWHRRG